MLRLLLVVVAVVLGAVASMSAQSTTGSIHVQFVDDSAGVLPGVSVTLVHLSTGVSRTYITDDEGRLRAPALPVGIYELVATLGGFEPHRRSALPLTIGEMMSLRVELHVAGVSQEMMVSAEAPILERSRTRVSSTIDRVAIQNLPVNGRNFLDFVLLTPGVTRDVRPGELSFAGQRGTLNSLVVDGADNNNTFAGQALGRAGAGRAPYQFSLDAVEEFQVNAAGYAAEYGRASGGVINVVTRSGANRSAGSLFEFFRDKALNATNALDRRNGRPKASYHYHQFGGTAGGPLRRNRDFFFFNYDGQRNTQTNTVALSLPAAVPADADTRAGLERLAAKANSWLRGLDQNVFLLKTDHYVDNANRLSVRYNHHDFTGTNFENTGGPLVALEQTGDSLVRTRTLNLSWSRPVRRLHNEFRVQYAQDDAEGTANSDDPAASIQEGAVQLLTIGRSTFSPRQTTIKRLQIANVATWSRGRHTVRGGADLQFDRIDNYFPSLFAGSYDFRSIASFHRGRPDAPGERYVQSFPVPGTSGPSTQPDLQEYSAFVQDEWSAASDLTFNVGVRYDLMKTAAPPLRNTHPELVAAGIDTSRLDPDGDNVAPRIGIAWSPSARSFVVRAGWGLFYGRTPAIAANPAHTFNGVNVVTMTFTGNSVPTYPSRFLEIPAAGETARPNIFYVEPGFQNPRVNQAHAAFEHQVSPNASVTLTYQFQSGSDLTQAVDRNLGTESVQTWTVAGAGERVDYPYFGTDRPFQAFNRVIAITSAAGSRYHGLTIDLNRRFAGDFLFRAAYTFGRARDTAPYTVPTEDNSFPSNPKDLEDNRAPGVNDQPHRFVASGVYSTDRVASRLTGLPYALARGWWASAILTAQSGVPYSARTPMRDLNNDGNFANDLAPGTRRNEFRLPGTMTLDTRLARTLRLGGRVEAQVIWEAFNLLNRTNVTIPRLAYYDVTQPTLTLTRTAIFGLPLATGDARIMQLGVKVTF